MKLTLLCCVLGLAFVAAPVRSEDKKEEKKDTAAMSEQKEVAVIKTSEGEMVAEFWPDVAPKTMEKCKKLAKSGFYDGSALHRVIKELRIKGGDPMTKDESKQARCGT